METAPDRKAVQMSTMIHAEKDWDLSPCAMMDHSGFIMAHGRRLRLRILPRLIIARAV